VLHFHDEPFQQGQAQSQIYTQPGSKWDNLLSGGGLGPGTTDPVTGYHSIVTPSLNFHYGQGTSGRLMLIAPPACVESVVGNDGSARRPSNGNHVFPSGFQGQAIEVRPDGDSRGLPRGERPRVHGRSGAEAPVGDAQSSAQPDTGTSVALAAALTTSSRLLALPPTPMAPTPEDVQRLDQLFAASLEDKTNFILPRSRHNTLSFGEKDGTNAAILADESKPVLPCQDVTATRQRHKEIS
jgi:hypothetical protein